MHNVSFTFLLLEVHQIEPAALAEADGTFQCSILAAQAQVFP